jgi:hypothetical protein
MARPSKEGATEKRVVIKLNLEEWEALAAVADEEERSPTSQVKFYLRQGLESRHPSPPTVEVVEGEDEDGIGFSPGAKVRIVGATWS